MTTLRKSRGTSWENRIVKTINDYNKTIHKSLDIIPAGNKIYRPKRLYWKAKRLAPSSTHLPDVMITYDDKLFGVEAKSIAAQAYTIELEQLKNASNFLNMFPLYARQYVVAAWYFSSKIKIKKVLQKERREIRQVLVVWDKSTFDTFVQNNIDVIGITCSYHGTVRYRTKDTLTKKGVTKQHIFKETELNEYIKKEFPFTIFHSLSTFRSYFSQYSDMYAKTWTQDRMK